jgi:hypothetical protein
VLDEANLSESAGLGSMLYRTRFYIPATGGTGSLRRCDGKLGTVLMVRADSPNSSGPIDWNGNLVTDPGLIAADLNYNGVNDSYNGFIDWPAVDLQQVSGGFAYSEGEIANGEIANGEIANGEIANGEIANGEIANGSEYNYESASTTNPPAPGNSMVYRTSASSASTRFSVMSQGRTPARQCSLQPRRAILRLPATRTICHRVRGYRISTS